MNGISRRILLPAVACLATGSCGSDPVDLTLAEVAGDYEATIFVGDNMDVIDAGGSLSLSLGADGTVAGSMVIPASVGGPLTADMAGTYTLTGNTIDIDQTEDTFVRDAVWTWTNGDLDGVCCGSSQTVTVRLVR